MGGINPMNITEENYQLWIIKRTLSIALILSHVTSYYSFKSKRNIYMELLFLVHASQF